MSDQAATSALEDEVEAALARLNEVASEPGPAFPRGEPAAAPAPAAPAPAAPAAEPRQPLASVRPLRESALARRGLDDDVGRFLATAERMLISLRNAVADAESAYVVNRAKLADGYRRRINELENEAEDAMRQLETQHRDDMAKRKRMMDALLAMRGE